MPSRKNELFRALSVLLAVAVTVATAWSVMTAPARASSPSSSHPVVTHDAAHARTPLLRSLPPKHTPGKKRAEEHLEPKPVRTPMTDSAIQNKAVKAASVAPSQSFEGLGDGIPNGTYAYPPDPNMAVGATQVVQQVNESFAVFSKSGTKLYGPASTDTAFTGLSVSQCSAENGGDGVVRWDGMADRWVITQMGYDSESTGPWFICMAVSTTADATGSWNAYAFQETSFPDYQKFGVWPDAYYLNYDRGSSVNYLDMCALNRSAMLAGAAATQQCFATGGGNYPTALPSDMDGTVPPPAGQPNTFVAANYNNQMLGYWKFHVDWANPNNTTLTGPADLPVTPWNDPCSDAAHCAQQPGTTTVISTNDSSVLMRLAYRNFGDHQSLVVNQTVDAGGHPGPRWYELRLDGTGTPTVYQQGTYAGPDSTARFMGSVAMDGAGNMALGYTATSSTLYPSVKFTGRLAGDPLGQLTVDEGTIMTGTASHTSSSGNVRWGDYSSMNTDPVDDCTFWYTNEYYTTTGGSWHTRIGSFQLPGCVVPNGGFESGALSGWTPSGAATSVVSSGAHSGTYAAELGSSTPTSGDSAITTTAPAPAGARSLTFWYKPVCNDTLSFDWATALLTDKTTGTTSTPLPHTCANDGIWRQVTAPITPGHSYTLTMTSHDDNYAADPTYTLVDDVTVG